MEPGEEESVGRYGCGARNKEGRALVELVARNGLAVASSSFFQKRESHKITYRNGQPKTFIRFADSPEAAAMED